MKLVSKYIEKDRSGTVTLIPQEPEDMWHTYNLLTSQDQLKCSTIRKVVSETSTGSTDKSSVRINLTIQVETLYFDTQVCILRVNGQNICENKHVKMGAYHTLDLELNRPFTIHKNEWDVIALERIDEACDIDKKAEIAAVMIQEGLANICLVTKSMTIVKQKIESSIAKKKRTDHDKSVKKFYNHVVQGIINNIDFSIVKVLIIASPGFVKDDFYKYLLENATSVGEFKSLVDNKSKIVLAHSSSGQKHSLSEILQDPGIQNQLADTKYATEVRALDRFYKMLSTEPSRAFYGFQHVSKAAERGGIETLLVTDGLFRSADIPTRKLYIHLVEQVRETGGNVLVFSSLHTSGERLTGLTGVAAILHFAMPDLEEELLG